MKKVELAILVYIVTIALSITYATQPLQPLLAHTFHIGVTEASAFTGVVLFSLAIAPIIYGYVLESFPAKKMLAIALTSLFFTNIILSLSNDYKFFLFIRLLEGFFIPAILTSIMSILAHNDTFDVKINMSIYVAATVFGGIIGRVFSGLVATHFGWRATFIALSLGVLIGLLALSKLRYSGKATMVKASIKDVTMILKDRRFFTVYLLMFCIFFVFAGLLNILPFRVLELNPKSSEAQIGLMYLGYSTGIVVALFSKKMISIFKTEIRTILFAIAFFAFFVVLFAAKSVFVLFVLLFLLCIWMFTIHSIASGLANSMLSSKKSITSGMYLTFYYIGGSVGSVIPATIYQHYGWNATISLFLVILIALFGFVFSQRKHFSHG